MVRVSSAYFGAPVRAVRSSVRGFSDAAEPRRAAAAGSAVAVGAAAAVLVRALAMTRSRIALMMVDFPTLGMPAMST